MNHTFEIAHELNQAYVFSPFLNRLDNMLNVIIKYKEEITYLDVSVEDIIRMTEIPARYVVQLNNELNHG